MPEYDITVELELEAPELDLAALEDLSRVVMAGEDVAEGTGLTVVIVDDDEIRDLNAQFLGNDEPTDVLSFPDEDDDFIEGGDAAPFLGDIAISLPTAQRQADAAGHPLAAEMAHLLVHGILHLKGYDHVNGGEEEARMRAREEHYLGAFGTVHHH